MSGNGKPIPHPDYPGRDTLGRALPGNTLTKTWGLYSSAKLSGSQRSYATALGDQMQRNPSDAALSDVRSSLLHQVGLDEVATAPVL